jgi:hypothetical protein
MLVPFLAVMATARLVAAANNNETMHVHGSVVFVRTGERTPVFAGGDQVLSALGAQQMHTLGQNFRTRYVNDNGGPSGLGVQQLSIEGNVINNDELLIQTLDTPYLFASAQAFMQGLYPPYSTNSTDDVTGLLANGSAMDFPMGGYQYAQVHTVGQFDAQSVYLGGNQNCPESQVDSGMYEVTEQFMQTKAIHKDFYNAIGLDLFDGHLKKSELYVTLPSYDIDIKRKILTCSFSDYMYATEISDYLSYAYQHDSDVYKKLNDKSNAGVIEQARFLADEKTWYEYGNTSASSEDSDNNAMGGKTLSALILGSFQNIVESRGNASNGTAHPLTLLFGEHEPMVSLFSLMMVDYVDQNFRAIPPFGSAIVFELYSTGDSAAFPSDPSELKVQFYYQNGTDFTGSLQSHPMFGHGPSVMELSWVGFQDMMSRIMVNTLEDWCSTCHSPALFCWGVDESVLNLVINNNGKRYKITPAVAGVIGAVVTLVVAGLLFAVAMLLAGVRFHRVDRRHAKSDLGGFKGSAKLASDPDLITAKNTAGPAAAAGIVGFGAAKKTPHERVGSWELRQKEFGNTGDIDDESRRGSFDAIESAMQRPVEPHARV